MRGSRRDLLQRLLARPEAESVYSRGPSSRSRGNAQRIQTGGPSSRTHGPGGHSTGLAISMQSQALPAPSKLDLLLARCSNGMTQAEYLAAQARGFTGWLDDQLAMDNLVEPALESEIALKYPRAKLSLADIKQDNKSNADKGIAPDGGGMAADEFSNSELLRRIKSTAKLREKMVEFWANHFHISDGGTPEKMHNIQTVRDVIRPNALGNFGTMLKAMAKDVGMLAFLNNDVNTKPYEKKGEGLFAGDGYNENYARELMELHTLGVDGGYDQKDVSELARCLTGRTVTGVSELKPIYEFVPDWHDTGAKTVLRFKIPARIAADGERDADDVLSFLAKSPSTANFIATKLCKHFISDNPSQVSIDLVASAFATGAGDIKTVLKALFNTAEFASSADQKFKRPAQYAISAIVTTGATLLDGGMPSKGNETTLNKSVVPFHEVDKYMDQLSSWLTQMSHSPFTWEGPDGYPDNNDYWMTAGALLDRANYSSEIAESRLAHDQYTNIDYCSLDALELAGYSSSSPPTPTQLVDALADRVLRRTLTSTDRTTLINFVVNADPTPEAGAATKVIGNQDGKPNTNDPVLRAEEVLQIMLASAYFNLC